MENVKFTLESAVLRMAVCRRRTCTRVATGTAVVREYMVMGM
jgi:hypothetical protein